METETNMIFQSVVLTMNGQSEQVWLFTFLLNAWWASTHD